MAGMDQATFHVGGHLMQVAVQFANPSLLDETIHSKCDIIRFGSEYCMYAIPNSESLKKVYESAISSGKSFVYVTPRLAEAPLEKVRQQLIFLNRLGEATVVANDLGTLRLFKNLPNLHIQLGRQLVYTPSRTPWKEITEKSANFLTKRNVRHIFYQTALNYGPTIDFFKRLGAVGADVDWIPEYFESLGFLTKNALDIAIHLDAIPAAITRRCHTGRFLGETNLEKCSKPCYSKAYAMDNQFLKIPLFLHGNAVFRLVKPSKNEISQLAKRGVSSFVITMSPLTGISSSTQIDNLVHTLEA
jgi:hypothetical protein